MGGEFSVHNATKTCTIAITRTFTGVEDARLGPLEREDDHPEEPMAWVNYRGGWQTSQEVEFATVLSEKVMGPISEESRQDVLRYFDYAMAVCMGTVFDESGNKLGGGLMGTNVPCKSRGLMPDASTHSPPTGLTSGS